jgi:hypothetical protein
MFMDTAAAPASGGGGAIDGRRRRGKFAVRSPSLRQSWRTARADGISGRTETRIEIVTKPSMFPIVVALVPLLVFALAGNAAVAEDVNVQLDQAKILRLPDSAR